MSEKPFYILVEGVFTERYDDWAEAISALNKAAASNVGKTVTLATERGAIQAHMVDSAGDERTVNNTVRHQYRQLTADERSAMVAVKDAGLALIKAIEALPACRESSIGITKAEEAVMWAVKGITK